MNSQFSHFIEGNRDGNEDILIVLDNASQHRGSWAQEGMKNQRFKVLSLPPYCPEFNPAEKLIKAIKMKIRKWKSQGL